MVVKKTIYAALIATVVSFVSLFGSVLVKKQLETASVIQLDRELSMLSVAAYKGDLESWESSEYYVSVLKSETEREDLTKIEKADRPAIPLGTTVLNPVFAISASGKEWRAAMSADAEGNLLLIGIASTEARGIINEGSLIMNLSSIVVCLGSLALCLMTIPKKRPTEDAGTPS
jgi:hypothetical protein